jgi:mono/diheme cytochrome c family protein
MTHRKLTAGCGVLTAILAAFLIVKAGVARAQKPRRSSSRARVETLYLTNCARCHGADGRGDTPLGQQYEAPDFTSLDWWQKNSENTSSRSLIATVTNGKGNMPAFSKKLKRPEIGSLVKYIRGFKGQGAQASLPSNVEWLKR